MGLWAPAAIPVRNSFLSILETGYSAAFWYLLTSAVLIAPTSLLTLLDLLLDRAECLVGGTADGANEGGAALHECVQGTRPRTAAAARPRRWD